MKYVYKKRNLVLIGFVAALYNAVTLAFPLALMKVMDSIIVGDFDHFWLYIGFACVSVLARLVFHIVLTWLEQRFTMQCITSLRSDLLKQILRFDCSFFEASPVSAYSSFMINDTRMLEDSYFTQIIAIIKHLSMLVLACVTIFFLNPAFLAVAACIYLISIVVPAILKKKIVTLNKDVITANGLFTKSCEEVFSGFTTIKAFGLMKLMYKLHSPVIKKSGQANMHLNLWLSISNAILAFLGIFMSLFVFIIGGWLVVSGILTAGALVALAELLAYTLEPIMGIIGAKNSINAAKNVIDNCDTIFSYEPRSVVPGLPSTMQDGVISLCNLNFRYANKENDTLQNINFKFEQGKKYAIIGGNGSGKSTLLKVLSGLYQPQNGQLFLNGRAYETINEDELREKVVYMEQNSSIFDLSIDDNVTLQRLSEKTNFNDVLASLKLDILAKDRDNSEVSLAQKLSGGEKQRISLARCLLSLSAADVFLADEPTAAMDPGGQSAFDKIIKGMQDKTCIVVTHRLSNALRMYDEILVMNHGALVDSGTYEDLVERSALIDQKPAVA